MPEGPEVRIMIDELKPKIVGKEIEHIKILGGRYAHHGNPEGYDEIVKHLPLKIVDVKTKGKFIYFTFKNKINWYMMVNFGMEGNFRLLKDGEMRDKHDYVEYKLKNETLYFNDYRNFGIIRFTSDEKVLEDKLNELGPDPLYTKITPTIFNKQLSKFTEKTKLEKLLLEQKFIAGIGNYLRADILWYSRLNPERTIGSLTKEEKEKFNEAINHVYNLSYDTQISGDFYGFYVYQKKIDPLGNPVINLKTTGNRTIWFVPAVQK